MAENESKNITQAGIMNHENPATGSNGVKASMTGAGSADSGRSQRSFNPGTVGEPSEQKWTEEFTRLEEQLASLIEYITPKANVHKEIKMRVARIKSTYNRMKMMNSGREHPPGKIPKQTVAQQTSPLFANGRGVGATKEPSGTPKRKGASPLQEHRRKKKPMRRIEPPEEQATPESAPKNVSPNKVKADEWEKVRKNKKKKKKKKQPPAKKPGQEEPAEKKPATKRHVPRSLPNALIIQSNDQASYAEVLKKMKADESLHDFGESVKNIRRTRAGEYIMTLQKTSSQRTEEFRKAIGAVLGDEATVKSRVHNTEVEIRDLDDTTTKENILQALVKTLGEETLKLEMIKSIRKSYGGTQTAIALLPANLAKKITVPGKLRVGWVNCRVRETLRPLKCFKCWQYGHLAKTCKSQHDRSNLCIKCGTDGHKAEKCEREPHCVLCRGHEKEALSKHSAGSNRCNAYKEALQELLRKRR